MVVFSEPPLEPAGHRPAQGQHEHDAVAKLEDEVKALETQVEELEQTLAETEDALSAAQEEAEKYRALYEELAGEESGTP